MIYQGFGTIAQVSQAHWTATVASVAENKVSQMKSTDCDSSKVLALHDLSSTIASIASVATTFANPKER